MKAAATRPRRISMADRAPVVQVLLPGAVFPTEVQGHRQDAHSPRRLEGHGLRAAEEPAVRGTFCATMLGNMGSRSGEESDSRRSRPR